MKPNFRIIGLAFYVALAPIAALAQDSGQAGSGLDGTATSPDGSVPDTSANPFNGAAGANKFYQDNSLTGSPQSNNTGAAGAAGATGTTGAIGNSGGFGGNTGSSLSSNSGNSNPPAIPTPEDSSASDNGNPFAGAAGANRFYQDNSLTGSMPSTNLGTLGGMGGNATSWATTP
jgi:hypothetical protein